MNENEMLRDDEISLFELCEKLVAGWRWIAGWAVSGALGAVGVVLLLPNRYEATAIVQVGQVGQVGQMAPQLVEPPAQAVERMKSTAFQFGVAQALGDQRWIAAIQNGDDSGVLTLATPKTAANIIELKAKGENHEAAKKIANAVIQELAKRHAEIAKPSIDRLMLEASIAREKLKRAESDLESVNKLLTGASVKDERFTQMSLMNSVRLQKEAEIYNLRQLLPSLDAALNPPATQPAKAIEEVFVFDKPVSPKKKLLAALGLICGLLVGVMWVFIDDAWKRARERRCAA